jgi:hypothetical protein
MGTLFPDSCPRRRPTEAVQEDPTYMSSAGCRIGIECYLHSEDTNNSLDDLSRRFWGRGKVREEEWAKTVCRKSSEVSPKSHKALGTCNLHVQVPSSLHPPRWDDGVDGKRYCTFAQTDRLDGVGMA